MRQLLIITTTILSKKSINFESIFEIVDAQHVPVRYPNKFSGATGREGDNIVFEYLPYIVFISLE